MAAPTPSPILSSSPSRVTPPPSCCEPNEVVVEIATTVLIPDYSRFFSTPITEFEPSYVAFADGSLASPALMQDLTRANISLLVTAMLATLFLRNIIVCIDYIRRANMKRRTLFYILLCSQLLSIGLAPLLASYFNAHLDCTGVMTLAAAATGISLALLMSGILGLKAYRCLDNSRVVLLVLVAFFCASSAVLGFHLASITGDRRLSGSCFTVFNPDFLRIYVLVQLAHSLFLCSCFSYAVWKSRASPAIRARFSVPLTLDFSDANFDKPGPRAWWENILGRRNSFTNIPDLDLPSNLSSNSASDISSASSAPSKERRTSSARLRLAVPSDLGARQSVSESILEQPLIENRATTTSRSRPTSLLRLIPRMGLFHEVMKDELCYTTTITVTIVILALLLVFGVNVDNGLDLSGWVATNEAIISVLVIHCFGRVIRRHEKEAMFQHPSAWWPERERSPYTRRFTGPPHMAGISEDPFSDARASRDSNASSWHAEYSVSPLSPIPAASRDRRRMSLPSVHPNMPVHHPQTLPGSSMDEKGPQVSFPGT